MIAQRKLLLSALIAAGLGLANAAQADILYNDINSVTPYSATVNAQANTGANRYTVYNASSNWDAFVAYCFEPFKDISIYVNSDGPNNPLMGPGNGLDFTRSTTLTGGNSANPTTLGNLQKLFDLHYSASLANAVTGAAFQLALWEIENEDPTNGYSFTGGTLQITNINDSTVASTAATYLDLTGTAADHYILTQWSNPDTQNFISADLYVPPPVPEPMTLSLVALGLAGVAASRGRKLH